MTVCDQYGHEQQYLVVIDPSPSNPDPAEAPDAQDSQSCARGFDEIGQFAEGGDDGLPKMPDGVDSKSSPSDQRDDALDVLTSYGEPIDGDESAALAAVAPRLPASVRSLLVRWEWLPDALRGRVEALARECFAMARLVWRDDADAAADAPTDHDAATLPRAPR